MADRGAQQAPWFTPEQLQALVDSKQIPPLVAQQQISWQEAQRVGLQLRQEQAVAKHLQAASDEVGQYLERVPDLRDRKSATMERVTQAAYEIAEETRLPITDPRVQKRALRQELGSLDSLTKPAPTPAKPAQPPASAAEQELSRLIGEKGISQTQQEWWDRMHYSPERRLQEAKFWIPRAQRRGGKVTS